MNIERNKGVFNLKIDLSRPNPKKDEEVMLDYNRACFLMNALIPIMDRLEENSNWRQDLKRIGNQFRSKIINECDKHQKLYINYGRVYAKSGDSIHSQDIYKNTEDAYEAILNWMVNKRPNHILSIAELIRRKEMEDERFLDSIEVEYVPTDIDLVQDGKAD